MTSEMSGYQHAPDVYFLHVPRCARLVLCVSLAFKPGNIGVHVPYVGMVVEECPH